jgi:hypothetical protein
MSAFDEKMANYVAEFKNLSISFDEALFVKVTKGLGPSIYNKDAEKVSCSQDSELATVKNNFCMKKLAITDEKKIDDSIKAVCEKLGSSNKNKYRAMFYYLLVKELGAEAKY